MPYVPDDRRAIPPDQTLVPPEQTRVIKDKVVVRDDSNMSGAVMLGALVAILLIGGALMYAFSGDRQTVSTNTPPATTGQRTPAPTPAPVPERAPAPKAQ